MSDQKYKLCVICKKNFAPLCKDDTICKACTSVALQNKNKNIPCEPYVKNVKEITFQDGTKVTSNKPLFRGQQDMNNCIPGTSNIAPRNSESTATLADHIAGPNNFGAKNTSFVSFTKNLKSAQEFGRGRDDNSSGTVLYADGNALYCNRNVNVHDVSTVEKAAQAFPGNTNPDKAAAKYAVVHQEVSIEANANGIPVKKGVTGMTNKSTYVTAKVASLTYPTTKGVVDKRINNKIEKKGNSSSFSSHAKSTVVKGPSAHCSASSGICDMIDRWDTDEFVQGDKTFAYGGVITTKTRKIATASAGVATWSAGTAKGIASVNASFATASATASAGYDGASAYANASLISAGAQLGPVNAKVGLDLTTGASVGFGGVDVSILGFGFSLGPKIGISCPFFSFSAGL